MGILGSLSSGDKVIPNTMGETRTNGQVSAIVERPIELYILPFDLVTAVSDLSGRFCLGPCRCSAVSLNTHR